MTKRKVKRTHPRPGGVAQGEEQGERKAKRKVRER